MPLCTLSYSMWRSLTLPYTERRSSCRHLAMQSSPLPCGGAEAQRGATQGLEKDSVSMSCLKEALRRS